MERLSAQDLSMVWPEDFGWPQDIGALAIVDGARLPSGAGSRFPLEAVREQISRRLYLLPRFRQRLYMPRWGLGWPLWVDDPAFDIAEHVNVFPRDIDGEVELLAACEQLRLQRLDRSRPLWQMWFLPGLADGRVGLFMKLHHAIADGVAGVAAFGAFLDLSPGAPAPSPPPWTPAPVPSGRQLFGDNLHRRMQGGRRTLAALGHPRTTAGQVRRAWPAVGETFAEERAPRTSLNRPIGADRTLALVRGSLDQVRGIAHAHHATVNDVLSAAVAGGLRALLAGRGDRVDGLVLRAFVPVSLHREQPGQARGNLDGAMIVPLPIGEADYVHRLRLIAAETAERKKKSRPPGGALFRNAVIQRAFLHYYADRQRLMNVYIANVPGPPVSLYLAGAPLVEAFPVVPILGNVPLGIGALSYAGQFNITVVADRDNCPDAGVFTAGLRASLDDLARAAPVPS